MTSLDAAVLGLGVLLVVARLLGPERQTPSKRRKRKVVHKPTEYDPNTLSDRLGALHAEVDALLRALYRALGYNLGSGTVERMYDRARTALEVLFVIACILAILQHFGVLS